jgi:hypothetical protein
VLVGAFVDAVEEQGEKQLDLEHQLQEQKPNLFSKHHHQQREYESTTSVPNTNIQKKGT